MQPEEINKLLSGRIFEICQKLFPNGKTDGNNYRVGDINGSEGESLSIPISGNLVGMFYDFADDESKGDLIQLWRMSRGLEFTDTMNEIKRFLGIVDDHSGKITKLSPQARKPKILKDLPKYTPIEEVPKWVKFLEKRKLSSFTASEYKIGVMQDKLFFPHFFESKPIMWHTRYYPKDENGKYIIGKDGKPEKKFGTNMNPQYCLWGWDGIKDSDRCVVITEGRLDALSYIEQDIPALSVPCGGGKGAKQSWIDYDYHHLIDHFDRIYISMDMDSTGQDGLSEIISRIGDHLCWIVTFPGGHKDANSAHVAGVNLSGCIKNAKQNTPEGLHRAGDFLDDIIEYFYPKDDLSDGMLLPWEKANGFMARLGEVTIIAGENGSGKSQVTGYMMIGGFMQGNVFGIASMEMKPKMLLGRLTRQITASNQPSVDYINVVNDYINKNLWLYNKKGVVAWRSILKSFLYLSKRYGVKYFIIDSLLKCGIAEDDYREQKDFIDELSAFAHDNNAHIFLIHHLRKSETKYIDKPPTKSDVKGTGSLVDMVDNLILFWRNRYKEEFMKEIKTDFENEKEKKEYHNKKEKLSNKGDVVLTVAKQRNGDWEGKVPLWFHKNSYQYLPSPNVGPNKFVNFSKLEN